MLTETDCCDGSDEKHGVCPNKCKEIGDAYKAKLAAERKLRKTVRRTMYRQYGPVGCSL